MYCEHFTYKSYLKENNNGILLNKVNLKIHEYVILNFLIKKFPAL